MRNPDLIGGFNRLDSTIIKSCNGKVLAKEGADGLLGLAIDHPDSPRWARRHDQDRTRLERPGDLVHRESRSRCPGFSELRNPYPLHRQKAFIVPGVVPDSLVSKLEEIPTWDEWDPNQDRWYYDWQQYAAEASNERERTNCGRT